MRKFIFLLGFMLLPLASAHAGDWFTPTVNQCIYRSSFTATNDTAKYISNSGYLKAVVVSSGTTGGWVKVYNSTFTTVNQVLPAIDLGTLNVYEVDLYMDQGITYTSSGNTNGVSFIYRKKE